MPVGRRGGAGRTHAQTLDRTLELEDALAHAERANASRSRFVAAASHDLLQPLSAAKLFISSIGGEGLEPGAQVALEKAGIMYGAGPMFEKGGERPAFGMIIVRANSFEEADAIAAEDPFHKAGLRKYEIHRWMLNEGSYTVTVNYSDQSMTIV